MNFASVNKKDQILMQLAHYFITVEDYTPIIVKGVQNEIWLENLDAPYKIIRINTNYIHNNEQLDYDLFKIKNIVKQVKRKTLSFSVKTLNILLDTGTNVIIKNDDKIDCITINSEKGLKRSKEINRLYPELRKRIRVTYVLIAINIIIYLLGMLGFYTGKFDLYTTLALHKGYVQTGEIYRLITACFTHENLIHLLMNMYALYVLGSQVESYIGKTKYTIVYLFSGIIGCLLSCIVNTGWSLGASGAIFGLMGTLLYFGLHYRLYLDNVLKTQIIPLIVINLVLGFTISNIDNAAHIGGLVGGIFMSMALGVDNKGSKSDRINGVICSLILTIFLTYVLFFL